MLQTCMFLWYFVCVYVVEGYLESMRDLLCKLNQSLAKHLKINAAYLKLQIFLKTFFKTKKTGPYYHIPKFLLRLPTIRGAEDM